MNKVIVSEDKTVGKGIGFERIRRITGYLVGNNTEQMPDNSSFQPWSTLLNFT